MGNLGLNLSAGGGFQGNGTGPASNLGHVYTDGFDFSTTAAPRYSVEAKKEDTKAFDFLKVNDINLHHTKDMYGSVCVCLLVEFLCNLQHLKLELRAHDHRNPIISH